MFGGIGVWAAACVAAATVAMAAGCGGSDDESTAKDEAVEVSAASQPADVFMKRMAKLLETTTERKDCVELEAINGRSLTRFECPVSKELRKSMASFEVVGAEEYGTGAVVDYKSGQVKDNGAIVLTVAPDRNWGMNRMGLLTDPSVGTDDAESRAGYEKAVEQYLKAVRERDCDAFAAITFVGDKPKRAVCAENFKGTARLGKRLNSNPDAKLRYEGGNETFGFYSLETSKPAPAQNITISVAKADEKSDTPYVVLDVTGSPTAAQQKQAENSFKKNKSQPDQPETSPSRKAS
jgi:hypothetical protein